ncbi:nucleoside triphosphate pyrophosphohydrolase [Labrys miyagiensis]|uniref:Nucleoside triphosphate pyrophosphohydrolase n=1 Tax=Labrys miyagiensis TaxID=346912 RepID=A0ABQ6CIN7_9HYPH|nr:nucleoside triphosphate pyrophosphohydrolase [Labrys miyagiensis]GLS18730.1 nucleoside triphosphate pyrophosphohydrolase [Labrys miyagiensis]
MDNSANPPASVTPSRDLQRLIDIMAALRTPVTGCPWDLEQDFASIAPYTIEEAYEVADAIQRGDMADLNDELGDLLLQVVFHAQMAREQGLFDFGDVVQAITTKLIRRHPHVFGEARNLPPAEVKKLWAEIKAQEKAERAKRRPEARQASALDGVPAAMPALTRAVKLQEKAGKVGFDWNDIRTVLAKVREEADEIEAALNAGARAEEINAEIGDLLFAVANVARHAHADAEEALRGANTKFERRFHFIEARLAEQGTTPAGSTLEAMDALWNEAKREGL